MKLTVHLPRQSEAELEPQMKQDLQVRPKFYKKTGFAPVFFFTVTDKQNREDRYVLSVSAANRQVRIEKLIECVPACDEKEKPDDADGS